MSRIKNIDYSIILSVFAIIISFIVALIAQPIHFIDDAWITFRFANNLAQNGELVFNLHERVEGITDALWALILAFLSRELKTPVEVVAAYTTLILLLYIPFRIWRLGLLLKFSPIIAVLPSLILILSPDFLGAATNGLETALYTTLIIEFIFWFIQKKYRTAAFLLGLLFITRPESIALGLLFCVLLLINKSHDSRSGIILYVFLIIFFTGSRLWYYGDFIPNSVRAKMIPLELWILREGVSYAADFTASNSYLMLIFFLTAIPFTLELWNTAVKSNFTAALKSDPHNGAIFFCIGAIILSFVVAIKNGGDWMPHFRLISQYTVIFSVMAVFALAKKYINELTIISIFFIPLSLSASHAISNYQENNATSIIDLKSDMQFWNAVVNALSSIPIKSEVVSSEAIGYISYQLSGTYIHDPIGLTNRYIANNGEPAVPYGKMDIHYTVEVIKPAIMIWHDTSHLKSLNPAILDTEYITFCYQDCYNWDADIVMIRKDHSKDFTAGLLDWRTITISSLHESGK